MERVATIVAASERLRAQFDFTRVPNEIIRHPGLSMQAKMVWIELWTFAYQSQGEGVFPGMDRIAKDLGVTDDTVRKYRKELEDAGLVKVIRRGLTQTNIYYLFAPEPEGCRDQEPETSSVQEPDPPRDKEDEVLRRRSKKNTRSDKPTRKKKKYPPEWYKQALDAYQQIKGITLSGPEFAPLQQTLKSIFMAGHTPDETVALMRALEASPLDWTQNWTLRTVKMKLPEWKAGKLKLSDAKSESVGMRIQTRPGAYARLGAE